MSEIGTTLAPHSVRGDLGAGANAATAAAHYSRIWGRIALIGVPIAGLVAAAWGLSNWLDVAQASAQIDRAVVEPRTFNVVLKEKGELKAARSTDIICEVEGRSTIITLIPEGAQVKKGDLLVELASDQIDDRIQQEELKESNAITAYEAAKAELDIQRDKNASDIRKAKLEIELKELELKKYEEGEWAQKLRDAEIAIEQAETMLKRRKEDFEAAKQLVERNFITQTEYEEDEFNYMKAQWDLEKAINAKRVLEKYTHVAELRKLQSDLAEATKEAERVRKNAEAEETKKLRTVEGKQKELALTRDQLARLRTQKEKCRITAPTDGFVVYNVSGGRFWSSDEQIKEGATVHERQVLLSLPDTSTMLAVVRVHEAKTDKLSVGQSATVTVESIPGKVFTGRVTKIAPLADTQNRWLNPDLKEYETEITLDPTEVPLKPSVTAYAEILVEKVEDELAVPVQAVYTKGAKRYVFRDNKRGEVEAIPVELGSVGSVWAEVESGLSRGDEVLLAFAEEHKQLISDGDPPADRRGPPGRRRDGADRASQQGQRAKVEEQGKERASSKAPRVTKAIRSTSAAPGSGTN